jgi:hypothetical protein
MRLDFIHHQPAAVSGSAPLKWLDDELGESLWGLIAKDLIAYPGSVGECLHLY